MPAPRRPQTFAPTLPAPQSQPEFLYTVGRVRALAPASPETARVLEIGCGDGGNLLPLAERRPGATCLGIDESEAQIAAAQHEAAELGLANIAFRNVSLADFQPEPAAFDYIIVRGVFSRVDAQEREKILKICQRSLAPHGMALVDYCTYPGWHVHDLLGSLMRHAARLCETAAQEVAAGRTVLEFLHSSLAADDSSYSALLRAEVGRVVAQNDAFIHRLYFQQPNHALYFREFVQIARARELRVLADAGFALGYNDYLTTPVELLLSSLRDDLLACEQYRDLVRNRIQRQSVLCRFEVPVDIRLSTTRLRGLYLEGLLRPENHRVPLESTVHQSFVAPDGSKVATSVPSVKVALSTLGANWPNYLLFEDLANRAATAVAPAIKGDLTKVDEPGFDVAAETARVEHDLLPCCREGVVQVHGAPPAFVAEPGERPTASALSRRQAAGSDVVTNRKHRAIRLDHFDRLVLRLLDGTRNVPELVEYLAACVASGQIGAIENNEPVPQSRLATFLGDSLEHSLRRLADSALLIA